MSAWRYAAVGLTGLAVDAAVFQLVHAGLGVSPYLARVPAFGVAVVVTYVLNRRWTFGGATAPLDARAMGYLAAQIGGILLNYGVFALLVATLAPFARWPVLAICAGSAVAAVFNYLLARALFARPPAQDGGI